VGRVRVFVVVAPGLERVAADELRSLGVRGRMPSTRGGIEVEFTTRQLYLVHRWSRIATRVLVRVESGPARTFDEIESLVATIAWDAYLRDGGVDGGGVAVHVASQASRLYHEGAIAERVLRVMARPADPDGQRVYVRVDRNRATISIDASGASLHHRTWRTVTHAAPLRPTLAAAMLRIAGYDGTRPVVDPMTGSGTIAIEAASIALALPHDRDFAFQRWPSFETGTWASVTASDPSAPERTSARVFAADRDEGTVAAARVHAAAAGVGELVSIESAPLTRQRWPEQRALVVCNPPYGRRIGERHELSDLYAALGNRVAASGHELCLLAADDRLVRATGLELVEQFATTNGGIGVRCWATPPR
jgi:putative N6-adenine-specific DNA methylase